MNNEDVKKLSLDLVRADTEEDVVQILTKANFWNDENSWRHINESPGNASTILNQQSTPDTALVEKIINSVDAVLMRECLRRGISPESSTAPKNIAEAQKKYFGIYNGKLSSIGTNERSELADNIYLVATGSTGDMSPSYEIIDHGEGQAPEDFAKTFLSLNESNKANIQFVQGKWGMGGTGVLRFGSPKNNMQLIISRRDSKIKDEKKNDEWGLTIIRRVHPYGEMRRSEFKYLAPRGNILSFTAQSLPLLPGDDNQPHKKTLESGTFVKLYEYQIGTGRLRSDATRHLWNRLSLLIPDISLPIKIADMRHRTSPVKVLSGLSVRLEEDKRDNIENDFPGSGELIVEGQKMYYSIYAFKPGKRETYAGKEGIIFTVNGQVHGYLPKNFFERKSVNMSYISDSILVIIDCTDMDRNTQEEIFMPSRDRLADGPLQKVIERKMETIVKDHPGLRALKLRRKTELVENKLQDSKPLEDVLRNIIKKSPSLSSLFNKGVRIQNPFNLMGVTTQEEFKGVEFPSYFKLVKEFSSEKPKACPKNKRFRVQYETDAENDYFKRDKEPGELALTMRDAPIEDYSLNLWNGLATINVGIPENANISDVICLKSKVTDISKIDPFVSEFYIRIDPEQEKRNKPTGTRKNPPSKDMGQERQNPNYLDIPNTIKVRKDEWHKHDFTEKSALRVLEDDGCDFYVNMDNVYLQMEIKGNNQIDPRILEARFEFGMVLIGISILNFDKSKEANNDEFSIYNKIRDISQAIAPTLLPMIAYLGDLDLDE